jgi:hypothetical protein
MAGSNNPAAGRAASHGGFLGREIDQLHRVAQLLIGRVQRAHARECRHDA